MPDVTLRRLPEICRGLPGAHDATWPAEREALCIASSPTLYRTRKNDKTRQSCIEESKRDSNKERNMETQEQTQLVQEQISRNNLIEPFHIIKNRRFERVVKEQSQVIDISVRRDLEEATHSWSDYCLHQLPIMRRREARSLTER
ncbi:hypothetical protein E2C01_056499 [Portunus trituberculatus]|uniref:Uncharacterized protein n=1 Tax=Portunus trituberculatus TaxID=210409 RepID=A0A5B7GYD0_PORTR|nr:hypothetical protein [Portunus trituberculatus]